MKRLMSLFLACGLLLSASLAVAGPKHLTLATGGTSGVYFPLGGAIAQVIGSNCDGKFAVTAQATGASGENMRLVQAHEVDFALVQNDVADAAYKGTEPFRPDNRMTDVVAIGRLYPEYLHVVAGKDSNVKTLEDFKGKTVSVGARGSGNEVNCRQIFKYFGLDYKNVNPIFLPYGETADQFKDRQLDGFVFTIGTPNPAIQDITTAQEVVFVPLEGKKVDEIVNAFPFLVKDAIPAGTYKGQDKPVPTLSVQCILVVNKNMSDEDVYAMTKALYDNLDAVAKAHNKGSEISVERAAEGITIPFHPGAAKYFAEKGVKLPR